MSLQGQEGGEGLGAVAGDVGGGAQADPGHGCDGEDGDGDDDEGDNTEDGCDGEGCEDSDDEETEDIEESDDEETEYGDVYTCGVMRVRRVWAAWVHPGEEGRGGRTCGSG